MPNYVKQHDNYSCGPVAIINLCKWAGKNVSYKNDFAKITKMCKCKSPNGTFPENFNKCLRKCLKKCTKIQEVIKPSMKQINKHLLCNQALVLRYEVKPLHNHFILIVPSNGKTFTCINDGDKIIKKYSKTIRQMKKIDAWFLIK